MELGTLIRLLEAGPDVRVVVETIHQNGDLTRSHPGAMLSWRGDYSQITLEPNGNREVTSRKLASILKAGIGKTMDGYKGGEYTIYENSPVWSDEWGTDEGFQIVAVRRDEDEVYLIRVETDH